jgi:D-glycero-beta-D-manno-heptose-7-phosphate kinase
LNKLMASTMHETTIIEKLDQINKQVVVIVGDIILDHYQWGEVTRISPEAPVPVVYVEKETYCLGGAANVARNIRSMGAEPYLVGVVGDDKYGQQIEQLLQQENIKGGIYFSSERKTTLKTRVMGNSQQIVRVDMESLTPLSSKEFKALEDSYASAQAGSYVIVSDYGKGLINEHTLNMIKNRKLIIDPKNKNFNRYQDIYIMTPNKNEAQEGSGQLIETREDIIIAGKKIIQKNQSANLLITMGPEGMVLFKDNGEIIHITTSARKVFDVTGAGDTVIGVLGMCLEAGIDLEAGCILANFAAGIVVGQIGTAAANKNELINAINTMKIPEINQWE